MSRIRLDWLPAALIVVVCSGCDEPAGPTSPVQGSPVEADAANQRSSFSAQGNLVLTQDADILLFDVKQRSVRRLCSSGRAAKYAVPLRGMDEFIVVSVDENARDEVMTRLVVSDRSETEIHRYKRIGLPVLSPDATQLAWVAEVGSLDNRLCIAQVADLSSVRALAGSFAIDNFGPSWLDWKSGSEVLLVATVPGHSSVVDMDKKRVEMVCDGGEPVLLPGLVQCLLMRDQALWIHDFKTEEEARVCDVKHIAAFYKSCRVSPDGRYAAMRIFAPMQPQGRFFKSVSSLVIIDIKSGDRHILDQAPSRRGPWAWIKNGGYQESTEP